MSQEIGTLILVKTQETLIKANEILAKVGKPIVLNPTIKFIDRTSRIAGTASYKTAYDSSGNKTVKDLKLKFNIKTARENQEAFLNRTIAHEVAHLMAFVLGDGGHGATWKNCCRQLGLDPTRTHSYKISGYVTYTCPCHKEFNITKGMHKKILLGENRRCGSCKGRIFLKPIDSQA